MHWFFLMISRTKPRKSIALLIKWMIECFNGNQTLCFWPDFYAIQWEFEKQWKNFENRKKNWIAFCFFGYFGGFLTDSIQTKSERNVTTTNDNILCMTSSYDVFSLFLPIRFEHSIKSGRLIVVKVIRNRTHESEFDRFYWLIRRKCYRTILVFSGLNSVLNEIK